MVEPLRHRQTKEAATDMFSLKPPRHIPTLPRLGHGRLARRTCGRSRYQPLSKCSFEPIQCCLLSLGSDMKRREFITLFGGAAVTWPLAARAQQPDRVRRIGVLMGVTKDEPEGQARIAALREGLQKLGWIDGRNIRIEERWADGGIDSVRTFAAEMVKLAPDLIVANGTPFF